MPDPDMTPIEQEAYDAALELIKACQREQSTALYLQGLGLTRLPPEIGQLANLTELSLGRNQLITLPPEIGQLANLKELSLSNNQLSVLPPEIGQLVNLTELFLYNNQLSTLPSEIGQLANLTLLSLSDNQLSTLPPEIGRLKQLEQLILEGNTLRALPQSLKGLARLQILTLHGNDALGLPAELLGPIFIEVNDENPPANPQDILDYYFVMRGAEVIERLVHSDAKESVMRELEQEAVSAHAPVGLFGTKWLMSMNEVISIVPSAYTEPASPNILKVVRKFYEREAFINFHFDDDCLMAISVLFFGPSSSEDFDRTQTRLSMDYGSMSAPVFSDKDTLVSRREVNRFAIIHSFREMDCGPLEMVSFYRSK